MNKSEVEGLISRIYTHNDFLTEKESAIVSELDDQLEMKGSISPKDIKFLKSLLRSLTMREIESNADESS